MNTRSNVYRGGKIVLVFCIGLLFAGCVKVSQTLTVYENGILEIEGIQDRTQLNEMDMPEGTENNLDSDESLCEELSLKKSYNVETETCEVSADKNIVTVFATRPLTEDEFQSQDGYFRFQIKDVAEMEGGSIEEGGVQMLRASGVEMNMKVLMPGAIIATNRGSFSGNTMEIDLIAEMMRTDLKDVIAISKLPSASGEIPWDIPETFITEASLPGENEEGSVGDEIEPLATAMQAMGTMMMQGLSEIKEEATGTTENAQETAPTTHTMRPVATGTPTDTPLSHQNAALPASGAENIFVLLWQWIVSLF